jgi:hypothetical protein
MKTFLSLPAIAGYNFENFICIWDLLKEVGGEVKQTF